MDGEEKPAFLKNKQSKVSLLLMTGLVVALIFMGFVIGVTYGQDQTEIQCNKVINEFLNVDCLTTNSTTDVNNFNQYWETKNATNES